MKNDLSKTTNMNEFFNWSKVTREFPTAKDAYEFRDQWESIHPNDSIKIIVGYESGKTVWFVRVF